MTPTKDLVAILVDRYGVGTVPFLRLLLKHAEAQRNYRLRPFGGRRQRKWLNAMRRLHKRIDSTYRR